MPYFTNEVIAVRHGQTEWNLVKKMQGHLDSPLTENGIAQAKTIAEQLRNKYIDIIISSPLGRALHTAKIIGEVIHVNNIQKNARLMERNLGVLQGRARDELIKEFPQFWTPEGKFIRSSPVPEGESLEDLLIRISQFTKELDMIAKTNRPLIVTHAGILHALVGIVKGIPFEEVQYSYTFTHDEPILL